MLAIHIAEDTDAGSCELSFETDEPLEKVVTRLTDAGFAPGAILDEGFGRSVRVPDADGTPVQINEHDRTLYT